MNKTKQPVVIQPISDKQTKKVVPLTPKIAKQSPLSHFGDKLKQWKPGESGNPKGRKPKSECITSLVKELLEQDAGKGKTYAQLVAETIVKLATDRGAQGNIAALKEILDRTEGKVKDELDVNARSVSILYELARREDVKGTGQEGLSEGISEEAPEGV